MAPDTHQPNPSCMERFRDIERRIDVLETNDKQLLELTLSVRDQTHEIKNMKNTVLSLSAKVDQIEARPAKRWEMLIGAVIGAIAGGLGMMLLEALTK